MSFTIGSITAAPGTLASGLLTVPARTGDAGTVIPVTIARGVSDGPVLALVAGTHGSEYVPIVALQRLRSQLDPRTLRGTLVLVHIANVPAFFGRRVYYSPGDGQNLNRVFPGKKDGTLSERVADVLTRDVIARATHVADLHGGDGNESLIPYAYWITTGDPAVVEAGRAMAQAFGLERIIVDRDRPTDPAASSFLSNTAITRGKPAITTETGDRARVDEDMVALTLKGIAGLLKHLGMHDSGPAPVASPAWIDRDVVLRAGASGLFFPTVVKGQRVAEGAALGRIVDYFGQTLEDIRAPFGGEILYIVDTPPINKGEPIGMVGSTLKS